MMASHRLRYSFGKSKLFEIQRINEGIKQTHWAIALNIIVQILRKEQCFVSFGFLNVSHLCIFLTIIKLRKQSHISKNYLYFLNMYQSATFRTVSPKKLRIDCKFQCQAADKRALCSILSASNNFVNCPAGICPSPTNSFQ